MCLELTAQAASTGPEASLVQSRASCLARESSVGLQVGTGREAWPLSHRSFWVVVFSGSDVLSEPPPSFSSESSSPAFLYFAKTQHKHPRSTYISQGPSLPDSGNRGNTTNSGVGFLEGRCAEGAEQTYPLASFLWEPEIRVAKLSSGSGRFGLKLGFDFKAPVIISYLGCTLKQD